MKAFGLTHVGRARKINQDVCYCSKANDAVPGLYIVADGMGGANAGELASRLAVEVFVETLKVFRSSWEGMGATEMIRRAMEEANEKVFAMSNANPKYKGMGTTMTAALCVGNRLIIGHVGDSRAYLLRDGILTQITVDHSVVQALVDSGKMSAHDAKSHPQRNLLHRAIGTSVEVLVDIHDLPLLPNDRYLICSDGLTRHVSDSEIENKLSGKKAQTICQELVELALLGGGSDNITVIVLFAEE